MKHIRKETFLKFLEKFQRNRIKVPYIAKIVDEIGGKTFAYAQDANQQLGSLWNPETKQPQDINKVPKVPVKLGDLAIFNNDTNKVEFITPQDYIKFLENSDTSLFKIIPELLEIGDSYNPGDEDPETISGLYKTIENLVNQRIKKVPIGVVLGVSNNKATICSVCGISSDCIYEYYNSPLNSYFMSILNGIGEDLEEGQLWIDKLKSTTELDPNFLESEDDELFEILTPLFNTLSMYGNKFYSNYYDQVLETDQVCSIPCLNISNEADEIIIDQSGGHEIDELSNSFYDNIIIAAKKTDPKIRPEIIVFNDKYVDDPDWFNDIVWQNDDYQINAYQRDMFYDSGSYPHLHVILPELVKDSLDFNGKENTKTIYSNYLSDEFKEMSSTDQLVEIYNESSGNIYSISDVAKLTHSFETSGTKSGDWYIPSIGQLLELNDNFDKLVDSYLAIFSFLFGPGLPRWIGEVALAPLIISRGDIIISSSPTKNKSLWVLQSYEILPSISDINSASDWVGGYGFYTVILPFCDIDL